MTCSWPHLHLQTKKHMIGLLKKILGIGGPAVNFKELVANGAVVVDAVSYTHLTLPTKRIV